MRAALTQGDLASWIVAGEYVTRAPARHRYDIGLSYSTQRYEGGNFAALQSLADGSRNAGALYGFDTFSVTPRLTLTYGGRYARYDYLDGQSLLSPRVALTFQPANHFRISTLLSSRAAAPGAEEFMPRIDSGIWLPPQRTFSSVMTGRPLQAEQPSTSNSRWSATSRWRRSGSRLPPAMARSTGTLFGMGCRAPRQPSDTTSSAIPATSRRLVSARCARGDCEPRPRFRRGFPVTRRSRRHQPNRRICCSSRRRSCIERERVHDARRRSKPSAGNVRARRGAVSLMARRLARPPTVSADADADRCALRRAGAAVAAQFWISGAQNGKCWSVCAISSATPPPTNRCMTRYSSCTRRSASSAV